MKGLNLWLAIISIILSLFAGVYFGSFLLLSLSLFLAGTSYVYEQRLHN